MCYLVVNFNLRDSSLGRIAYEFLQYAMQDFEVNLMLKSGIFHPDLCRVCKSCDSIHHFSLQSYAASIIEVSGVVLIV